MVNYDQEVINGLKKIVKDVGIVALSNHARANALVSDYFPGNDKAKIRKLLKPLIDYDAFSVISKAKPKDLDLVCEKLKDLLVNNESIAEDRAETAIRWVCSALGTKMPNFPKPVPVPPPQPKPQPQPTPQPRPSTGTTSNPYRSPQTSASRSTVSKQGATPATYGLNLSSTARRNKQKKRIKKLIGALVTLAVIGAIASLACFVVWPRLIFPILPNEDFNTPEIVQVYSGTYTIGGTQRNAIVTITSCDNAGKISGFFEFTADNAYGKYEITGQITEKKNNGNLKMSISPGAWIVQPDGYVPLETMEVEISDEYQSFQCTQYNMYWAVGEDDESYVQTVEDLQKLVNSNGVYRLKNDIDLSGVSFTPIEGFSGMLLGNGFAIKNLTIQSSESNVGFFATLSGTVANLNFENVSITVSGSNENVGALCGVLKGNVSNISVSGIIDAPDSDKVGGIIGYTERGGNIAITGLNSSAYVSGQNGVGGIIGAWNTVTVDYKDYVVMLDGFENSGTVTASEDYVGGIFGYLCFDEWYTYTVYMTELKNTGDISGKTYVGGLIGYGAADNTASCIKDSSNASSVTAEAYVGCIAGQLVSVSVDNCTNDGSTLSATKYVTDSGEKYAYVGGFVGRGYLISNCTNTVSINYTSDGRYVGGVMGYTDASGEIAMENLKNSASITGKEYVGGIIGAWNTVTVDYKDYVVMLDGFENSGTVTASEDYVGGIFGYLRLDEWYTYTVYMTDFRNTGNVSGKTYVGGLIGYGESDSDHSSIIDASAVGAVSGTSLFDNIAGMLVKISIG